MPTHAELTAKLLNDAATFFRMLAENNAELRDKMNPNAKIFDEVAQALRMQPRGYTGEMLTAELAGKFLTEAATFFLDISKAKGNEAIKEQMEHTASIYQQMGQLVGRDPLGVID